jgi:hypothetical protein
VIDLDAFLRLVEINALAAPEPLILQSIRQAALRFCERTRLWRDHDTIETDGVDPEPVSVPNDSVLFEVLSCSQGHKVLHPITFDRLARERPHWRHEGIGSTGGSRWYICPEFGTILALPRCSGVLHVEIVVKPSATADSLPDFLLEHYGQDIANGASALVLAKPDVAFGNMQLAGALNGAFETRLASLSTAGSMGQQKGRARVRARMM